MSIASATPGIHCLCAFDANNRLAVRTVSDVLELAFANADLSRASQQLSASLAICTEPAEKFTFVAGGQSFRAYFVRADDVARDPSLEFRTIESLEQLPAGALSPPLAAFLASIDPFLIEIPYLHLGENDFIYKFRPATERNIAIYAQDSTAQTLYQSQLCSAIKALARRHERSPAAPVTLDFGAIRYIVPSHFGFCLGVKNAIERAYETLAENPRHRVFMLSELIHNPFVNEDLMRRGLRYLQTDKGTPYTIDGRRATAPGDRLLWDTLVPDDIVIVPAFGATDEDKRRLVRKGISVFRHDATCMLVEKVWKDARAYGRDGFTVIIHGKHEHEETKATFSNTRRYAPAVIVRNLEEARALGAIATSADPAARAQFYTLFKGRHTPGFDVERHLNRVAVVNQTTLLMNETRAIIEHLRAVYRARFGDESHVGGTKHRDTLCYATQVNQDALALALAEPLDAAFVIGGKNSSNTYQLFRLCAEKLGSRAFFIQSEASILSLDAVEHYVFPAACSTGKPHGYVETRPLWPGNPGPKRVLVTGGASCPDGIIQQVITRINALLPPESLRPIDAVLADLA